MLQNRSLALQTMIKEVQDSESEQTKQRAIIKIIRTKLELKHS